MVDTPAEVMARQFLLMHVLMDWEIPIRQRSILFLEIFGNALVTGRTARYIDSVARGLVELITDGYHPLSDVFDLTNLKFRDRDYIENTFKSWFADVPYDVESLRDQRLRHYYGDRYDVKKNVLDWDYQVRGEAGQKRSETTFLPCFTSIANISVVFARRRTGSSSLLASFTSSSTGSGGTAGLRLR